MKTMNLASVRNRFSQLADEVHECGEGVIVAKYGHPFVMLVPVPAHETRKSGRYPLRGLPYWESADFDAPMPELTAMVAESGTDFGGSNAAVNAEGAQ